VTYCLKEDAGEVGESTERHVFAFYF